MHPSAVRPPSADVPDPWGRASSRAVHPSATSAGDVPLVASIAEGLAAVSLPWELATGTSPTERAYEQLLATPHYDVWLIHWPPGTGLDAHDHGGSSGAFAVVSGTLDEDVVEAGTTTTRHAGPGATVSFGADHVHAVVNRGAVGATSVHVYSPPLRSMSFHDGGDDGDVRTEAVTSS